MSAFPATGPIGLAELATRLERAARAETFSINELELLAAREDLSRHLSLSAGEVPREPPLFGPALSDVRRQALALAMAATIAEALRARPELAVGLGIALPAATEAGRLAP
ncbi:hypothetical protein ABE438_17500 [Bosea sp. TWI1241]|uniref:hypothetical protein n=1 Tax=Bosea sp. TWI1241 TaxID=3148904 RepID=UPI003209E8C3